MYLIPKCTRAIDHLGHPLVPKKSRDYDLRRAFRGPSVVWQDRRKNTSIGWIPISEIARHIVG